MQRVAFRLRVKPERLQEYLAKDSFKPLTDHTVTDRTKLARLIDDSRRVGFAAVEDELAYGVVAVAVPVFDQGGRVVAALNSSSHSRKISKSRLVKERVGMLQAVARQISQELARVPGLSLSAHT